MEAATERLFGFSDAVFAVIITVLVLELKAPEAATFAALYALWPSALSYAVSYLFVAIVWVNHRHVLRDADAARSRVTWANFAHLFAVSLVPFATAWIAGTELAPIPVSLYAAVFAAVNITYLVLLREGADRRVEPRERRLMRVRCLFTLAMFTTAAVVALWHPIVAMTAICLCLALYLRPSVMGLTPAH